METSNYRARSRPGAALAWPNNQPFIDLDEAHPLAQAIVDTIRDPFLVLDQDLRVVTANRAFHQTFKLNRQDIQGRPVYRLGDGQWDIPELRLLLEDVAPEHAVMEAYEVERDFPVIGRRSMLLNAREVFNQRNARNLILLTFEDVTDWRAAECEITELLQQKKRCCRRCSIVLRTACRSSPASFCSRRARCSRKKRGCILGTLISESCRWRPCNSSCWPRAMASRSKSALIFLDCARPWQLR